MPSCARVNSVVKKMLSINRVLIILLKSHVTCTHFMPLVTYTGNFEIY